MPISSHCFWTWLNNPAGFLLLAGKADAIQCRLDPVAPFGIKPGEERMPGAPAVGERQFQVLEDGQVFEDGRALKFPANAKIGDVGFIEPGQILAAAEKDFARIRPGLARD